MHVYERLPGPARSIAASLRGLYLRSWRYGPETERLVEEALQRERWGAERWRIWQAERLAYVLHRAARQVPYYRNMWAERRRHGDRSSYELLENWPILEKETLRENPTSFVADDRDVRQMFHEHTSGTTGKPLDVWWSKATTRNFFALFEARLRRWNGVRSSENWAILGGQPVIPARVTRPPFWVWNAPMKQLYLSSNHLSPQNIPAYVNGLTKYRVNHMIAYSSSVSFLARVMQKLGLQVPSLKLVITNAEPLVPWQRETIRNALNCDIQETYGMAEITAAASSCAFGIMHLWPEVGWLEILHDTEDLSVQEGNSGRIVCSSLLNADMPLVRYAVGDRGRMSLDHALCDCGRRLPVIGGIEGRTSDLLITREGHRVYWLNPVFYGMPVSEAQIIQETLDHVRVRFVPARDFNPKAGQTITERLQARLGDVKVILEGVDSIPRAANGKFRPVICNLSAEGQEKSRIEARFNDASKSTAA
jgi:phenylacetate-CoA ligase